MHVRVEQFPTFSRRRFLHVAAGVAVALGVGQRLTWAQTAATPAPDINLLPGEAAWIKYNLNTISKEAILAIPGTGDRMVTEFEEYRPYTSIAQFRKEIGKYVDADVVASYEAYLFVPVDPASADADTIQQLPGVDADKAKALLDGGPYAGDAAFLDALSKLVTAEQVGLAQAFLSSTASGQATWIKYNLNTMTEDQILAIPGTGDRMVREFTEYRPYASIEQFRKEIGKYVDADVVAGYERYVFVPVDPNQADEATLQQLPGVDADTAKTLIDGRPYADQTAFLAALGKLVAPDFAALAPAYLVEA
jgi:DNA uptake protein ComE-like DNA-binding protein